MARKRPADYGDELGQRRPKCVARKYTERVPNATCCGDLMELDALVRERLVVHGIGRASGYCVSL